MVTDVSKVIETLNHRLTQDRSTLVGEFNQWVSSESDGLEMMVIAPSNIMARKGSRGVAKSISFIGGESFRFKGAHVTALGFIVIELEPLEASSFDLIEVSYGPEFDKVFGEEVSQYLDNICLPSGRFVSQATGITKVEVERKEVVVAEQCKTIYSNFGEFS